jgi:7-cyano-7-deazaguanine synthase
MAALNGAWKARLGDDHVIKLDALAAISETALTRDTAIAIAETGLPTTFVPGRNLIFSALPAPWLIGAEPAIWSPACVKPTIPAIRTAATTRSRPCQVALSLGLDKRVTIHTPLMWIDKADTFAMAEDIGGKAFLDLVIEESHSCYLGDRTKRHDWGYGCGECPACQLRAQGFEKFSARRKT